jgi:hypothetical protein
MHTYWKSAIAVMLAGSMGIFFTAMTLLMLRDWIRPRRDLGLKSQHWAWALLPAVLTVWAFWMFIKHSIILFELEPHRVH